MSSGQNAYNGSVSPKELIWQDVFLLEYLGPHLKARLIPVIS